MITSPQPQRWGWRRLWANRLKWAGRGQNVAKECSNNNEICSDAWNNPARRIYAVQGCGRRAWPRAATWSNCGPQAKGWRALLNQTYGPSRKIWPLQIRVLAFLVAIGAIGAVEFLPLHRVGEAASPDGAFIAVTRISYFNWFLPVMPGQSGDHPGRLTIYRNDGRSCGSAPVDMVWMIDDLRWELSRKPREASIVALATWDLDACSIEIYDR
jgi:hypothetical protein